MKKLLFFFGLIAIICMSCRETPNPVPKTPPVDNPSPKPELKTLEPETQIETSDKKNQ